MTVPPRFDMVLWVLAGLFVWSMLTWLHDYSANVEALDQLKNIHDLVRSNQETIIELQRQTKIGPRFSACDGVAVLNEVRGLKAVEPMPFESRCPKEDK